MPSIEKPGRKPKSARPAPAPDLPGAPTNGHAPDPATQQPTVQRILTAEDVAAALRVSYGNALYAAKLLGCIRDNVYKWCQRTPWLQKLQRELLEEEIDEHEFTLRSLAIEERHPTALLAFLNAKARHRGWGRTDSDRAALQVNQDTHLHLHLHGSTAQLGDLSDSDLDRLIADRRNQIESGSDTHDPDSLAPLIEIIPPQRKIAGPTEDS